MANKHFVSDVVINIDTEEASSNSEKPIIQLIKTLITSDSEGNTVLTNHQIIDILNKEFNIEVSKLHELEKDIYITVVKKYLKDWPQWDELDTIMRNVNDNKQQKQIDDKDMKEILDSKYISLKSFLKSMLDLAEEMAKPTIKKCIKKEKYKSTTDSNLVLEIHGSRTQLNQLIFRQPHPNLNNTVFNPNYALPPRIQVSTFPIEAILNWWGVSISITNRNFNIYKRETKHEVKHKLVNKKLSRHYIPVKTLDQDIKVSSGAPSEDVDINNLIVNMDSMDDTIENGEIYNFIKQDLEMLPEAVPSRKTLMRYTNKYPYVRYLFKEVDTSLPSESTNKYDLQLQEIVSPCYHLFFHHFIDPILDPILNLHIRCQPCAIIFRGPNLCDDLKSHFNSEHINELEWTCTNCSRDFSMINLAQNWWCHRCAS